MIGSTLQQVSRVRSNTTRLLALFLALGLMAHGLYFPEEWLIFGFGLSGYLLLFDSRRRLNCRASTEVAFGLTDAFLLGMLFLSLLGVFHPIKVKDGLIETLRWGIFWFVFRLGVRISSDRAARERLARRVEWLGVVVACIGWVPWVSKVAGRLSSVFGYPNATAAFLGAVLLLYPSRKPVRIFLGMSLLGTGSRAGVGLFLTVLMGRQLLLWVQSRHIPRFFVWRQGLYERGEITRKSLKGLWIILLEIIGIVLVFFNNRPAWENLTDWSFSSSSWQERLVYFKDGISLAWKAGGLPRAGGWLDFSTVQHFPYWTADPHSSFIHILLNQGAVGIMSVGIWGVLTLARAWKTWGKNRMSLKSATEIEEAKADVRVWGALFFLVLHSLVDADFSFGVLGLLFWMLFGSIQKGDEYPLFSERVQVAFNPVSKVMFVSSLILCLFSGSVLLKPVLLEKETIWNTQAQQWREKDPAKSIVLWNMSLDWDQTQISTRRAQAELLFRGGNTDAGLKAVEEVLHWQPLDLEAYEWAQSLVWDGAEVERRSKRETAVVLYRWVEVIPQRIEERAASISSSDRLLWQGSRDFQPSPHIKLLAEYARERHTHLLPKT